MHEITKEKISDRKYKRHITYLINSASKVAFEVVHLFL